MGWVEIAFIALFFGVGILGRSRRGTPRLPPVGETADDAPRPEMRGLGALLAAWEEAVTAAHQQAEAAPEPGALDVVPTPALALPPVPSAPVVAKRPAVEVAVVDRDAEHARFHERVAPVPASAPRVRPRIRNRGELRRAVLMAEVLGPPRSLRELDTP